MTVLRLSTLYLPPKELALLKNLLGSWRWTTLLLFRIHLLIVLVHAWAILVHLTVAIYRLQTPCPR